MKVGRTVQQRWTYTANTRPAAGSLEESHRFGELQAGLADMFQRVFPAPRAARTIVAVPSMSLDRAELTKLVGVIHYEERLLCLLMLLRFPAARIVFVSSESIPATIVDYYLRLLPDISDFRVVVAVKFAAFEFGYCLGIFHLPRQAFPHDPRSPDGTILPVLALKP